MLRHFLASWLLQPLLWFTAPIAEKHILFVKYISADISADIPMTDVQGLGAMPFIDALRWCYSLVLFVDVLH